jgi:hypothetical protein
MSEQEATAYPVLHRWSRPSTGINIDGDSDGTPDDEIGQTVGEAMVAGSGQRFVVRVNLINERRATLGGDLEPLWKVASVSWLPLGCNPDARLSRSQEQQIADFVCRHWNNAAYHCPCRVENDECSECDLGLCRDGACACLECREESGKPTRCYTPCSGDVEARR